VDPAAQQIAAVTGEIYKDSVGRDNRGQVWEMVSFERPITTHEGRTKSAVARDGPGEPCDIFNRATDVAWNSAGNIYVAEGLGNSRVAKFDRNGVLVKSWDSKKQPANLICLMQLIPRRTSMSVIARIV
jgi:DNA-binding beta-propeller fold protein YncE